MPDWSQAKRRRKDLGAAHTKKHGKSHFGYKLSASVDLKHGFIRCIPTGTASEHDGHHFEEVLGEQNTSRDVSADKAYRSRRGRRCSAYWPGAMACSAGQAKAPGHGSVLQKRHGVGARPP